MKKYLSIYLSLLFCAMCFTLDAMAQGSFTFTPYAFEVVGADGGNIDATEGASKVVDGDVDTKWCKGGTTSFKRIEYLENTGNAKIYFQTGYRPVANTVIEVKYQTSSDALTDNQWRCLFAARTTADNGFSFYVNNRTTEKKYGYFVGGYKNDFIGAVDGEVHTAICSLGGLKIDGVDVVTTGRTTYTAADRNLAIFGNPGIDESFKGKIYYVKVYEGDRLMKYYVPVKDGESYAFFDLMHGDKVEKTGDGTFTAGPDLNATATQHFVTFLASDAVPCSVDGFSLTTGGDTYSYQGRNPVSCTLYGGADGKSWEPIEHFDGLDMPVDNKATKYFKLSKPSKQYKYFQMMFTSLKDGNMIQLSEITLTPCLWGSHSNHNMWRKVDEDPNVWTWKPDGSGIDISVDHTKGSSIYDATITNANNVQWNNQFGITAADFPLKQSMKYNVYCVLQSDKDINDVTMKLLENGGSDDATVNANYLFEQRGIVDLQANKTYVFKANNVQLPTRDAAGVRLIFDLAGAPSPTQFRVANIYMEPAFAPDWDYNDPRNAWKEVDRKSTSYTYHTPNIVSDIDHQYDTKVWEFDIKEAPGAAWGSCVQIHSGYPVKKSSNYCFYAAIMVDKDVPNATIKLEQKGVGSNILLESYHNISLQAGVPYYFKRDFASSNVDFDDLSLAMDFDGAQANTHVIVSDIYLSELEDWDYNSTDNKWKGATTDPEPSWGKITAKPTYDAATKSWSTTISEDCNADWAAGVKIKTNVEVKTANVYDVYMSIMVDKEVEGACVKFESNSNPSNFLFSTEHTLSLKAYTPYIFKIADQSPNADFNDLSATVSFHTAQAGTNVTIKDIYVSEDKERVITNGTKVILRAEAADGTPLGYLDRNFQPSPDGIPFMLEKDGGNTYLRNQEGRLSYYLFANVFRNAYNQYYQRDDLEHLFAQAQLQYYNHSESDEKRKYPQLKMENGETDVTWNTIGGTWVHNADLNISGSYWNYARRYVQLKFYESGKVRFILKDNNLQDNSRPMEPAADQGNRTLLSEFTGKGTRWDNAFYMTVATGYPHNDTSAESQVIYPTTDYTKAIKLYFEKPVTVFVPYEGDTYSGVVGTDIPNNLLYNGEAFKSHADDGRILPETGPIQRTHENEREVWVFPGYDYELLPYSDFKTAGQYEETYNRWYDYATGKKSDHIFPVERDVVDIADGLFGGSQLTGNRVNGTSVIYRAGSETTNNIWLASPAMTHSYTPGHVTFNDKVYQMSDVSGATVMKRTSTDPETWADDGTATKDGDKITVNFTGASDETKRVFINPGYNGYENSVDYKLHIKVKATRAMSNVELYPLEKTYIIEGNPAPGFEKSPQRFDLAAGEEKELWFDFSEGINAKGSRIWLDNITAGTGDQLEIYDIYILKGTPPTAQPLKIEQKNNSYKFSLAETDGRWRAMVLFDEVYLNVNNFSDYTFKFKIKSSSALKRTTHLTNDLDNGGIFVKLEDCGNPGNFLFAGIVEISDAEAGKEVEKVITIPRGGDHIKIDGTDYPKVVAEGVSASVLLPGGIQKCKVLFDFGSNPATDVEINNIVLMDHTETTNAELLDIIAMDASCSFTTADNINFSGVTQTITEPNVHFRNVFVVKNAKVRADILSDKTKGPAYVAEHKEKLMAPAGAPFQYRLASPERWDFDDKNTHTTDYWYKIGDTGDAMADYKPVYHYLIETWKKDGSGVYQLLGKTINDKDGTDTQYTPGNVNDLARLYKSANYIDRVFYIQNPTAGEYQIRFYAIKDRLDTSGGKAGLDRVVPIYYYGQPEALENRMLLMEYDLKVLPPAEGNMLLWDDLYDDATYTAKGEKNPYIHQRPTKMVDLYGEPTTVVNFDELDPARLQLDANGDGYYKWPRKWEESSYAFGYDKRHDYNMYVVANNAKVTPYKEAIDGKGGTPGTGEYYDILYKESGGKKKGFFYYTNAAGDPGRMTLLNIGEDFCQNSTVYVSAWVMEFSKVGETANVVFSFKGVDANGTETTLNSFVTGYVTGGDNKLSDGTNPDNRGKWHHVYYSFHPEVPAGKKFDHFIISVENNCVNSGGADYAIDDIRAFVCKPVVYARQRVPICDGDKTTKLILTAEYDQLKDAFNFAEDNHNVQFYYCFVDKDKYQEGIKDIDIYSDASDRAQCRLVAFNNALVKNAYGPAHATYGILKFDGTYNENADYNIDPDGIVIDPSNPDPVLNVARKYVDPDTDKRLLVFPSFANDHDMVVGKSYIVAMVKPTSGDPTASDFGIDDACSATSKFTVMTSGQVKIDGELASAQNGASVCANQIPKITIDMSGISNLGTIQTTENAYFDWYKGPKTGTIYYMKAPDACTANNGSCSPLFTWGTDLQGNVVITISAGEGDEGKTKFRNSGMNGTFSLDGNAADFDTYFNKGKKDDYTYVLTLKDPETKPAIGATISYTGQIECMSSMNDNDWSDYSFTGFTYGEIGEMSLDRSSYNGVLLLDALTLFHVQYPTATEENFEDLTNYPLTASYTQAHHDCIKHFLDEGKVALYKNSEFLSTYDEYQNVMSPDEKKSFYITAIPINPTPGNTVLKYCLEPFQVVLNLSTRTPRMKNGDDSGLIPYPGDMRDVPLRIGLKQLNRVRMADLNTKSANFLYMPLRDVTPATTGVDEFSLIQKADDDFIYLIASTDPDIQGGTDIHTDQGITPDIKIIGKVSDISAKLGTGNGNVCHLAFLSNFRFREGYDYTIKFKFEENYSGVIGDHSDVCPGDVVCTIKVVPEYQMWTGAEDSNWNNDKNWKRVSSAELLTEIAGTTYDELWNNASATYETYLAPGWAVDANSTANYNTTSGVMNVHIAGGAKERWQGQLQLNSHATLETSKEYTFSCDIVSTKDINNMCFQFNKDQAPIIEPIQLAANTPYHLVVEHCVPIPSSNGVMIFDTGATEDDIDIQISNFSITHKTPGSNAYYTDGVENDNLNSYVPADFTKVIIPANATNVPKLHNLRRGTASTDPDDASTNLLVVHFTGAPANCNYIKDMTAPATIGEATDRIKYHMSSIDIVGGIDNDNVACRSWYDHTCQYIHFNSDAQMLSQQYLHYEKAWADFEMEPNKWTTVSSPLINVVAGDLYLPTATARQETPLFEDITFDPNLHDRFHPAVYQRTWNAKNAKVVHLDGDNTNSAIQLDWSQVYNDVNVNYSAGVGFSIKPDVSMMAVKPAKVKFRLPKADTNYHYWNPNHQDGDVHAEDVPAGILDEGNRTHRLADLTSTFAQRVEQNGQNPTKYYLIGNPMMCYLDMKEFFERNEDKLESKYWIVTGKGQQYAVMDENTEGYVGTVDNKYVAPFQSFFVKLKEGYTPDPGTAAGTFTPSFDSDMMVAKISSPNATTENAIFESVKEQKTDNDNNPNLNPDGSRKEDPITDSANSNNIKEFVMTITATDEDGNTTTALLTDGQERSVSGVEALFDKNLADRPMLYTNVKGEAMSLSNILPGDTIPLALSGVKKDVELHLQGSDTFTTAVYVIDTQNGETRALTSDITLQQSGSGVRYYLVAEPKSLEEDVNGLPQIVVKGHTLTVNASAGSQIDYLRIYRVDGVTMADEDNAGESFTITLPTNVYLIDVVSDGQKRTFKIAIG